MKYCRLLSLALALLHTPALAQSPEALNYFRTGYELVKKGNYRNAAIELEKAVEADSSYGNAHYVLGISYKALNEYDKAIASFTAAHALGTKPEQSTKAIAQLYKKAALNSYRQKKYNEVITYLTKSQELGGLDAQSLYIMGLSYSGLHEKDKAAMAYAAAITADPTDARPYNALGDIQRRNRDYGKAVATYQRSIEADPTYMDAYGGLARVKFETEDIEGVVPILQKALEIDDTYAEGHRLLGIALNRLGRFHEAIAPLSKAADLDKNSCETHYRLGEAHYGMGNFRQAIEHGRRATSCQTDYRAAEVLLGDAHFQLGQGEKARRWYNRAVNDSRYKDYAASKLAEIDEQHQ